MTKDKELQRRFEKCVDQCADSMFRVAFRLTGNRTLASELVQETYLNAWKCISGLKDPEKMRGWLFAILRNQYSKLIRKESRSTPTTEHLDSVAAKQAPVDQTKELVQSAIAELEEIHKLPLLLVSMEGMSVDQTAEVLGVPRGTVLSRLHRARQKLKQILIRDQQSSGQQFVYEARKEGHDEV